MEEEAKLKIKLYTTSCSIQIQPIGPKNKYDSVLGKASNLYFAEMILKFAEKIQKENPDLDERFIPQELDNKIKTLRNKENRIKRLRRMKRIRYLLVRKK